MTHFMVDLETMGNDATAPIVAIGCVAFKWDDILFEKDFYKIVDLGSVMEYGIRPNADTIYWWLEREKAAQSSLLKDKISIYDALSELEAYMREVEPNIKERRVWGNGASFDNPILSLTWKRVMAGPAPWEFWNDRCYRTIKAMYSDVKMVRSGTYHNALDDAMSQTKHFLSIIAKHKLPEG